MIRFQDGVAILSLGIAAASCGGSNDDAGGSPTERPVEGSFGLRVVSQDEGRGALVVELAAAEGHRLAFEMRLGPVMDSPPTAEELAQDPDLPTHTIDARVIDADGHVFMRQRGGDAFIDESWADSKVAYRNEAFRAKDIELVAGSVEAFRALEVAPTLDDLRRTAVQIGLAGRNAVDKPGPAETLPTSQPRGFITYGPDNTYEWDFKVMKKNQVSGIIGNHSAIILRAWSTESIVATDWSCNHGSCANASNMSQHCVMPGFLRDDGTNSRFFKQTCSTSYNATSVWGHNCNDDTELQIRAIYADAQQCENCGSCNSAGAHNYAPGCARP